jgi:hypothetical protein
MKYAKELAAQLKALPWWVRVACIDYRAWKKKTKTNSWKASLLWDCCKCEAFSRYHSVNKINLKTMYKVCKRLEKRYGVESMRFYYQVQKSRMFKFMGSYTEMLISTT